MKKLLINRKPIYNQAWGGGNLFVKAVYEFANKFGYKMVENLYDNPDVILMHDPRPGQGVVSVNQIHQYKRYNPRVKIIHRVNECDARKNTNFMDVLLRDSSKIVDATVFVSNWMKRYHTKDASYKGGKHFVVYNGVNLAEFDKDKKLYMKNGKVNLVTHHWSNNRMKGFDLYEKVDRFVGENKDKYTFTYIGRELGTFKNTKIVSPLHGQELANELLKYTVYISGSKFDPGPNHILEALACGLPTYAINDGGGAAEFVGHSHTMSEDGIMKMIKNKSHIKNSESIKISSWETCAKEYFDIINEVSRG